MEPLPFRPLTLAEENVIIQKIHQSDSKVVFVSLGCPKQEYWMNQHKGKIQAVMIGLGGVFLSLQKFTKSSSLVTECRIRVALSSNSRAT
jgi:N-acetylglucosaminyldiphosphoundecaprenol N-acetyl-beta-D-mannosaminyltransferase